MKMYILVRQSVPDHMVPVVTAHASLACYKRFENDPNMIRWVNGIFKKVVCSVNDKEFENSKKDEQYIITTESALNGDDVAITFCPREEYSKQFKFFELWKPSYAR
jgi:hypothetical protein